MQSINGDKVLSDSNGRIIERIAMTCSRLQTAPPEKRRVRKCIGSIEHCMVNHGGMWLQPIAQ
jgi:hypothetical protein